MNGMMIHSHCIAVAGMPVLIRYGKSVSNNKLQNYYQSYFQ
jgi:hypothetical protein